MIPLIAVEQKEKIESAREKKKKSDLNANLKSDDEIEKKSVCNDNASWKKRSVDLKKNVSDVKKNDVRDESKWKLVSFFYYFWFFLLTDLPLLKELKRDEEERERRRQRLGK